MVLEEKLKQLNKNGFFTIENFFSLEDITIMSNARNNLVKKANSLTPRILQNKVEDSGAVFVYHNQKPKLVSWAGKIEPVLFKYGRDPKILKIVREVFHHHEAQHLINQIHFKLPDVDDIYPIHLDIVHRQSRGWNNKINAGVNYLQIAVALDHVTEANAPLRFVPGYIGPAEIPYTPVKELNENLYKLSIPLIMKPGDAVFFNHYVPHGSGSNLTYRSRGLFITGFAYPGACTRLDGYPGEGVGKIIALVEDEPDIDTWMNEGGA
jgi:ectoine hydroxylase-related dioxygenase (phytanoyl-CoA dioxygenase family)